MNETEACARCGSTGLIKTVVINPLHAGKVWMLVNPNRPYHLPVVTVLCPDCHGAGLIHKYDKEVEG